MIGYDRSWTPGETNITNHCITRPETNLTITRAKYLFKDQLHPVAFCDGIFSVALSFIFWCDVCVCASIGPIWPHPLSQNRSFPLRCSPSVPGIASTHVERLEPWWKQSSNSSGGYSSNSTEDPLPQLESKEGLPKHQWIRVKLLWFYGSKYGY